MFGLDLKDPGRYFALWDFLKKESSLSNSSNSNSSSSRRERCLTESPSLLRLSLEVSLLSQSRERTIEVLREMYIHRVYPTPQLASQLAAAARQVTEVHLLLRNLLLLQQHEEYSKQQRRQQLLQTRIDEHELEVYRQGRPSVRSNETEQQQIRRRFFEKMDRKPKPWLPLSEFIKKKQKGGEEYAKRHDRPSPNTLDI
ncbi:Pentatricopeptide repeat-containing protein PFL1605w, related [Eimeria tenella]|uniref:Pentatricopeptide repeat-containing protein PFL1605w, related n=1 Tax=Eimeria tenella TaxID=5802 RepID=U6L254_EIMTE|nr:Pentatricopeptide repeat-containing protein PFL1605w, related [Eimeria tenella]CDJ44452.1 Pentatricopeptide repeat-containing protein PFL1605w, related [Eimeria tenella]|eukprot:XP_013235201.1 Pentatricopeptide repeat-containing protein PFL1605w, related [Eimeria tenella]